MSGSIVNLASSVASWFVKGFSKHLLEKGYEEGAQAGSRAISEMLGRRGEHVRAAAAVADAFLTALKNNEYEAAQALCTRSLSRKLAKEGGARGVFGTLAPLESWQLNAAHAFCETDKWGMLSSVSLTCPATFRGNTSGSFKFKLFRIKGWQIDTVGYEAPLAAQ